MSIWIAIASGYFIISIIYGLMLLCFEYKKIKNETKDRLDNDIYKQDQ